MIADEPTTALDVTIQAQLLELLRREQTNRDMALVLITHDLGVVAGIADRVAVMYAGRIVEEAEVDRLFSAPQHPYTIGACCNPSRGSRARSFAGCMRSRDPRRRSASCSRDAVPPALPVRVRPLRGRRPPLTRIAATHAAACWADPEQLRE